MKTTELSEDLIEKARNGNRDAENELFELLRARFLGLTRHILRSRDARLAETMSDTELEDIVQDALSTVYGKYKTEEFYKGFIPWANGILRNKVRNHMSRATTRNKHEMPLYEPEPGISENAESRIIDRDLLQKVIRVIQTMGDLCKKILGIFVSGGGPADVARIFPEKPRGTLDNLLFRCRKRLRALVEGYT